MDDKIYKVDLGKVKGENGFSPIIRENKENTEDVYRLDIITAEEIFTTPNLKGAGGSGAFEVAKWQMTSGSGLFAETAEGTWMAEVVSTDINGASWAVYAPKDISINIGYSRSADICYYFWINEEDIGHNLGNQPGKGTYLAKLSEGVNTFRIQTWKYSSSGRNGEICAILPPIVF